MHSMHVDLHGHVTGLLHEMLVCQLCMPELKFKLVYHARSLVAKWPPLQHPGLQHSQTNNMYYIRSKLKS